MFQRQLNKDIKQIKRDCKILSHADKSRNKMDSETYKKLLHENITKSYKKTDKRKVRTSNIAKKSRKIQKIEFRRCKRMSARYITVKNDRFSTQNIMLTHEFISIRH